MNCTNCGQPVVDADVYCGTCGADLNAQRAAAAAAQQPPPAPGTQPLPAQGMQPPPVPAQAATSKNKATLWIVLGILAALLLLCSCGAVGAWAFWFGPLKKSPANDSVATKRPESTQPSDTTPIPDIATSATPDEAVKAVIPEGWVIRKVTEKPQQVEYWGGPPDSEFTTVYLVNAQPDGGWLMTESSPLQAGGDVRPTDEAMATVEQFLRYIQADDPMKAQALTVEPFHSDGASAQYSNGEFLSFSIDKVEDAGDNTIFVSTTENWKNSTDRWTYRVVPTEAGMRIRELMPAQ